jgi:hypothetical protein
LNELAARVEAYGKTALKEKDEKIYPEENPLQFRYFWDAARKQYGDIRSKGSWILISKDILEESRKKTYAEQVAMIQELSKKSSVNYEVPTLRAVVAATFLHKVATNEDLFQLNNQDRRLTTYTRVQEETDGWRLAVGGSSPSGVRVNHFYDCDGGSIGVAARRKF